MDLNRERQILTIRKTILVIGSPCVNKHPYDYKLQSGRFFPNSSSSQYWKNVVKVLSWRFYQCLEPFNMLTIFFFLKMFKIWWRFHKWNKKPTKCFLFLRLLNLNRERQILTIRNRILVLSSSCGNKQPYDFKPQSERYFPNHFSSQWWKNMVKMLSWRF